jgi:hypothetical protein
VTESIYVLPPEPQSGDPMCERCNEIIQQILDYRRLLDQPLDPLAEQRIAEALKKLEERKAVVH